MKQFICEAKTEGPIERATLIIKADCCDDAREILVETLGLGAHEIYIHSFEEAKRIAFEQAERFYQEIRDKAFKLDRAACLERDQRARGV